MKKELHKKLVIGWQEKISIPEWDIPESGPRSILVPEVVRLM